MATEVRSTTGCWTCKVRRKKCPEEKPTCAVCSSLRLECGGYGSRPDWMDGGAKEKEKLARIREAVKDATNQRKRAAMKRRHIQTDDREILGNALNVKPLPYSSPAIPPLQEIPIPPHNKPLLIDGPPPGLTPENTAAYIAQNESVLLMHYLDYVFPCQFRFYQPSLEDGGRGWLLSLLMQTKPLYYAACSLAAYHRQMKYCLEGGMKKACFTSEALHLQYDVAISELRSYLEVLTSSDRGRTLSEDVQLLCSIVLLISIEGFISNSETWQVHLAASLSIFPDINKRIRDIIINQEGTAPHRAALSFFSTTLAWYSIISCATIGSEVFTPCSHKIDAQFIHFDKVVGCENWVLLAIKDVVLLDQWKNEMKTTGQLSVRELVTRGNEIESRLNGELENIEAGKRTTGRTRNLLTIDHDILKSTVTRVYHFAALVYLHVTISGALPSLPEIGHAVTQSIEAFKSLPDPEMVNNLIWPFCIAGCMATEEDQDFFREFSRFGNPNDGKFGASKAGVIMEECWRLRQVDPSSGEADWKIAMHSLGFQILLV